MKWISVKERLPEKDKKIWVLDYPTIYTATIPKNDDRWWNVITCCCNVPILQDITHWAEIEPPKDEE